MNRPLESDDYEIFYIRQIYVYIQRILEMLLLCNVVVVVAVINAFNANRFNRKDQSPYHHQNLLQILPSFLLL